MAQPAFGLMLQHLRTERGFSLRELGVLADLDQLTSIDWKPATRNRLRGGHGEAAAPLKAARRESDMLRFLSRAFQTDPALVSHVLSDPT